jgi:Carboxypeptidase regulatory-like domain
MYNINKEDVPVVGGILYNAFVKNKAEFENFSPIFSDPFEAEMAAAIQAVKDRRRPADVLGKQKMVTQNLHKRYVLLQEVLRLLGEYVKLSEVNLATTYANYHIKEARKALNAYNAERVLEHCELIIDKVTEDAAALDVVGFDSTRSAEFVDLVGEIDDLNKEQVIKMNERQYVKSEEDALFATMYSYIEKVSSVGKAMYTYRDKHKFDDFTVSRILRKINHVVKKKKVVGESEEEVMVYDVLIGKLVDKTTDAPLEMVVVRIVGTDIMTDTDGDGEFYIDEIPAGVYSVSFSKKGYVGMEQHNVEIGRETMVELRVEMLPEGID